MEQDLDRGLADFLKAQRGETSFYEFARRTGVARSVLQRIEYRQQGATLKHVAQIAHRLNYPVEVVLALSSAKSTTPNCGDQSS